ncbi:hypothetical protein Tsubulata_033743 [Turnera subulata]|uniref:Uncharacterized protein n=1 Tax=Turnera subulata TaxID=218843 RepID=A0A9Q0GFW2_9ROSI|nr:hypothetical protein Tsubulata_033743 [Turnera subulata]
MYLRLVMATAAGKYSAIVCTNKTFLRAAMAREAKAAAESEKEFRGESSSSGGQQPFDRLGWIRGELEGWSLSGWSKVELTVVGHRPCCVDLNAACWASHTSKEDNPYDTFLLFSSDEEEEEDEDEE